MNASVQLLRQVIPSVVHLKAAIPADHPSAAILGSERMGTGTLVARDGLVLTVNYVVLGAQRITVTTFEGQEIPAQIVAQDFASGLALVRIRGEHAAVNLRSSSDLEKGEEVFLFGSVGDGGHRVSSGAVTGLGAFEAYWEYAIDRSIVATVMNPGLGGGPMFDRRGRMVGVVSLNLNEIGRLSLAIPVEHFLDHRDDLLRFGRPSRPQRAWIGVYCYNLQDHVVLAGVMPGSPAESAGLRGGDVLLAIDDVPVSSRGDLYRQLWRHPPGDRIPLRVFRGGDARRFEVDAVDVEDVFG